MFDSFYLLKFYAITGFFLSLIAFGEVYGNALGAYSHPYTFGLDRSPPLVRDTYAQLVLDRDKWLEKKPPVPYAQFWNNKFNQTAQQMVAICSVLQKETKEDCLKAPMPVIRLK